MNHIAIILPTLDSIGGAESQTLLLAKGLKFRSWRVTIITLSGSASDCRTELALAGIEYLSLEMRKAWIDPYGWLRYITWHRLNRPDIVHTHLPHASWFARFIRLLAPIRVQIDTLHTTHTGTIARQILYLLSSRITNLVTCVSQPVADAALKARTIRAESFAILPNGVLVPEPPSRSANIRFHWLAIGRLSQVKDYPTLLQAFAQLPNQPQLTILGAGPDLQFLTNLAAQLQIADQIHFAGFQRNIRPFLLAADAFVLSSRYEGLPIGLLEAAAAQLPTVATNGPGTREAMVNNITGLLVPVADSSRLSSAMAHIMNLSPISRLRMGIKGREFILENFDIEVILSRWEKLYEAQLSQHPSPSRWG